MAEKTKAKMDKSLAWVEERQSKLLFGPPLFDETLASYNRRKFKRGFVWGK